MTDKELRRLKRGALLEMLYYLKQENEMLREEIRRLREQPVLDAEGLRQFIRKTVSEETAERSEADA